MHLSLQTFKFKTKQIMIVLITGLQLVVKMMEKFKSKPIEQENTIQSQRDELEMMKKEMANLEMKISDIQESVKTALTRQRQKYERRMKNVHGFVIRNRKRTVDILTEAEKKLQKKDEELEKREEKIVELSAKCEYYQKSVMESSKKQEELGMMNKKSYDELQEKMNNVLIGDAQQ